MLLGVCQPQQMAKTNMWFKTRVGFVSVTNPTEILVAKNTKERTWCIYTRLRVGPEMTMKSFLRSHSTVTSPTCTLAAFSDGPGVGKAIAGCMAQIEDSIRTKTELCDLSQAGDPQAWQEAWHQIEWPKDHPGA